MVDTDFTSIPYETVTVNLAANEIRPIYGTIKYLSLISATSLNGVRISFTGGSFFSLPAGINISDFKADVFWIQDTSGAANVVTIAKGNGVLRDNRLTLDATSGLTVTPTGVGVNNADGVAATATTLARNDSYNRCFNGTTWDRIRGNSSGLLIQGPVAAGSAIGTSSPILNGGSDGTNVQRMRTDTNGNQIVVGAVAAGSAIGTTAPVLMAGSDGTNVQRLTLRANNTAIQATGNATVIPGHYNSAVQAYTSGNAAFLSIDRGGKVLVTPSLSLDPILAGATQFTLQAAATTNLNTIKASAGAVKEVTISNQSASPLYAKLFNKASNPTLGTDVPFRVIECLAGRAVTVTWPMGAYFTTGIAFALTRNIAWNDNTAVAANDAQLTVEYT